MAMLPYIPAVLQIPCKQPAGASPGEYSNSMSTLRVLKKALELIETLPDINDETEICIDDLETMIKHIQ